MAKEHLKSSYKTTLWLFALVNVAIFWSVVFVRDFSNLGQIFSSISARDATFAALGPVAMLILNGVISAPNKVRAIYWRYTHTLPDILHSRAICPQSIGQVPARSRKSGGSCQQIRLNKISFGTKCIETQKTIFEYMNPIAIHCFHATSPDTRSYSLPYSALQLHYRRLRGKTPVSTLAF